MLGKRRVAASDLSQLTCGRAILTCFDCTFAHAHTNIYTPAHVPAQTRPQTLATVVMVVVVVLLVVVVAKSVVVVVIVVTEVAKRLAYVQLDAFEGRIEYRQGAGRANV